LADDQKTGSPVFFLVTKKPTQESAFLIDVEHEVQQTA